MTTDVNYNIEMVKGVKTALFGGEGLFFATLRDLELFGFNPFHLAVLQAVYLRLLHTAGGGSRDEGGIGGSL